jgi:hypothetical protein
MHARLQPKRDMTAQTDIPQPIIPLGNYHFTATLRKTVIDRLLNGGMLQLLRIRHHSKILSVNGNHRFSPCISFVLAYNRIILRYILNF